MVRGVRGVDALHPYTGQQLGRAPELLPVTGDLQHLQAGIQGTASLPPASPQNSR